MPLELAHLQQGHLYRDTLSGRPVLVITKRTTPCGKYTSAEGYWFNPITGKHETLILHDGQLETTDQRA